MPDYQLQRTVPYSAESMFDLVADIDRYPRFVPGYREARVVSCRDGGCEVEQVMGVGPAHLRFRSHAVLNRPTAIAIRTSDGPFSELQIDWDFTPLGERRCRVGFRMHYRLRPGPGLFAGVLGRLVGPQLLEAFVGEARRRYGAAP